MKVSDNNSHIYFVSQEDAGYDYWVMKFSIRPNYLNDNFSWSIGKSFYDGDIFTKEMDKSQWQEELVREYDYVVLYKLNGYFYENFSDLFMNPDDIEENVVYRVDKKRGLLEKCM